MQASCLEELCRLQASAIDTSGDSFLGKHDWAHLFISVLPPLPTMNTLSPSGSFVDNAVGQSEGSSVPSICPASPAKLACDVKIATALKAASAALVSKFKPAFRRAAVAQLEIRLRGPQGEAAWRVAISLPTGHEHGEDHVEVYREVNGHGESLKASSSEATHSETAGHCPHGPDLLPVVFGHHSVDVGAMQPNTVSPMFPLHGHPVWGPYPALEPLQQRRLAARRLAVTYCYDFPSVFEDALREIWASRMASGEFLVTCHYDTAHSPRGG